MSRRGNQYAELPPPIAGAVREEAILVASRTPRADGDVLHSGGAGVPGDHVPEIDRRPSIDRAPGELAEYVRAHLVAWAADGGTEMEQELGHQETSFRERPERAF